MRDETAGFGDGSARTAGPTDTTLPNRDASREVGCAQRNRPRRAADYRPRAGTARRAGSGTEAAHCAKLGTLPSTMIDPADYDALAARVSPGARARSVRRLTGGVSASTVALEIADPAGDVRTVVVRSHGRLASKTLPTNVAAMELELLRALFDLGVAVPEPLLLDTEPSSDAPPRLVMAFVDGTTEIPSEALPSRLDAMADALADLHALPTRSLPALPSRIDPVPELLEYVPDIPERDPLRAHLAAHPSAPDAGDAALLHGDYWPGNLLWRDTELAAILDWEDAAIGDPHADVATARLELHWSHGASAVERFTRSYSRRRDLDRRRLALWEILASGAAAGLVGTWGLAPDETARMRNAALSFCRTAAAKLLYGD